MRCRLLGSLLGGEMGEGESISRSLSEAPSKCAICLYIFLSCPAILLQARARSSSSGGRATVAAAAADDAAGEEEEHKRQREKGQDKQTQAASVRQRASEGAAAAGAQGMGGAATRTASCAAMRRKERGREREREGEGEGETSLDRLSAEKKECNGAFFFLALLLLLHCSLSPSPSFPPIPSHPLPKRPGERTSCKTRGGTARADAGRGSPRCWPQAAKSLGSPAASWRAREGGSERGEDVEKETKSLASAQWGPRQRREGV